MKLRQRRPLLQDASLSLKLLISPAVLILALGIVALLAIYGLHEQRAALDTVHDISIERTTLIDEFIAVAERVQADLFQISVLRLMDLPEEEIQPVRQSLERGLSDLNVIYGQILTRWPLDGAEQTLLEEMAEPLDAFQQQVSQAAAVVSDNPSFGVLLVRSSTLPFAELQASQQAFLAYQQANIVRAEAEAQQRATRIRLTIITLTFLVALVGVFTTSMISARLISRPIRRLTNLMGRLAEGNLAVEVGDLDRRDEIGAMARAVEVFRQNAIEKVQAERALRESEERYRLLAENVDDVIWILDQSLEQYTYVSPSIARLLDYSPEEMRARPMADFITPDHYARIRRAVEQRLAAEAAGRGDDTSRRWEGRYVRRDGALVWVESTTRPLRDENGRFTGLIGVTRDITARKQAEAKLRQINEEQRVLLELMPVAVTITDDAGQIIQANRMSEQLLGITLTEQKQRRYDGPEWQIIQPDGAPMPPEEYASVRALLEQRPVRSVEMGVVRPDGAITWISVSAAPMPLEGYGVAIAYADITDRKRAEESLRKSQSLLAEAERLAGVGAWEWDIPGDTFICSIEWQRIHGVEQSSILVKDLLPIAHPDDQEHIQVAWQDALDKNIDKPYDIEHRIIRQDDGQIRVIQAYGEVVRNEAGQAVTMYGAAQDITERKQAEEALQRSQILLDASQKMARVGGWEFDVETLEQVWTEETYRIHEVGPDYQPTVETGIAFFSPQAQPVMREAVENTIKNGESYDLELTIITARGNHRWVRAIGGAVWADGKIAKVRGTIQDITARKETEEALRRSSERLQILRQIDRAVLAAEPPEVIAEAAVSHLYRLVPYTLANVIEIDLATGTGRELFLADNMPVKTWASGPYALKQDSATIESLKRGRFHLVSDLTVLAEPSPLEQRLLAAGLQSYLSLPLLIQEELIGSLNLVSDRPELFSLEHIEIGGEVANSLALAIEHARLYEQARRDAEEKTMLLREVNHRVSNNLGAILGILSLEKLRFQPDKTDPASVLEDISARIKSMAAVHRMLSASQWSSLDLTDLATRVIEAALSGSPIQNRIRVSVLPPEAGPVLVTPEEGTTLGLIINELTTNSAKHAFRKRQAGRIEVQMMIADGPAAGPNGSTLQLRFRDDGPGWPEEVLAGKRQNIGLELLRHNVSDSLKGQFVLKNENGAVALVTFRPALSQ